MDTHSQSGLRFAGDASILETWRALCGEWTEASRSGRLWAGDAGLWTGSGEDLWLGWLEPGAGWNAEVAQECSRLADESVDLIVVIGMGGSSLGAELLVLSDPAAPLRPTIVLDSIDPLQVERVSEQIDPARTLFVVASKSGTTLETAVLADLFWQRAVVRLGAAAGSRFVAVSDPGSRLEERAAEQRWAASFSGVPTIGGRFSVLSPFGLVPLALAGGDVDGLLSEALTMAVRCREGEGERNPAVALGLLLAAAAQHGRGVAAIQEPPTLPGLGPWLEQLLAESTGKEGLGVLPVLHPASDRRHHLEVEWTGDVAAEPGALVLDHEPLGAEIFRWMTATAVLGSALGVDPFTQPGVESAKVRSRELLRAAGEAARDRRLPEPFRFSSGAGLESFGSGLTPSEDLSQTLSALFASVGSGGYLGVLAWVDRESPQAGRVVEMAESIQRHLGAAVSVGFGPRYLHSTGQFFKGGPATGSFLVLTHEAGPQIRPEGRDYDLETLEMAQARGDFEVLAELGRPIVLVHLGSDLAAGLETLERAVGAGLG